MTRPLRRTRPGAYHFLSDRCLESRLFLTPRSKMEPELLLRSLATACAAAPEIELISFVQMPNHWHAIVRDTDGSLSRFMQVFASQVALRFNGHLRRSGAFWHRRYSHEEIVDRTALRKQLAYLVANPVAARQVDRWQDWDGLVLWAKDKPLEKKVRVFDAKGYAKAEQSAKRLKEKKPRRRDFFKEWTLVFHPINSVGKGLPEGTKPLPGKKTPAQDVVQRINKRQQEAREKQPWCKGMTKVRDESPLKRPKKTKRSNRPVCHASCPDLWLAFLNGIKKLRKNYDVSSKAFRQGDLTAPFPEWTFRPPGHTIVFAR